MNFRMISATIVASVAIAAPAFAGAWDEEQAACASAIAAEAGVESSAYDVKLAKARDGRTKRLTVELSASGQPTIVGECRVRRGEVVDVTLDA